MTDMEYHLTHAPSQTLTVRTLAMMTQKSNAEVVDEAKRNNWPISEWMGYDHVKLR